MPPAVQPEMKSVLSNFVYRPDLTRNRTLRSAIMTQGYGRDVIFLNYSCIIQQTHKQTCMKKTRRQTPKC